MQVTPRLATLLQGWAKKHGTTVDDLVSRGILTIGLIRAARDRGLTHLGFVADPRRLDAELRGLFPERPHLEVHGGAHA